MSKEKTIFIVTDGEYSEYGICAVFDSKEDASLFVERFFSCARIEEWPLNPGARETRFGLSWFQIRMTREGDLNRIDSDGPPVRLCDQCQNEKVRIFVCSDGSKLYQTTVCAKDQAGAVKVANERRIRAILEEEQQG